jgi:hypothetical protein
LCPTTAERPNQIHHFASNKSSKFTAAFEKIAKKYGLDLDESWNKELLAHQGRHPYAYHEFVLDGMKQADKIAGGLKQNVNKFLDAFDQLVKQPIRDNPDLLRSIGWE